MNIIRSIEIDKFDFWVWNCLVYNQKINRFFVINILLDFFKYYILEKKIKKASL